MQQKSNETLPLPQRGIILALLHLVCKSVLRSSAFSFCPVIFLRSTCDFRLLYRDNASSLRQCFFTCIPSQSSRILELFMHVYSIENNRFPIITHYFLLFLLFQWLGSLFLLSLVSVIANFNYLNLSDIPVCYQSACFVIISQSSDYLEILIFS